jgi:hypothetical protein
MKLFLNNILILFLSLSILVIPSVSFAGDVVAAGTKLEEDSYVFTIEEATNLLARIEELEIKEAELEKYKGLETLRLQQIDLYKINLDYSESQIQRYISLNQTNETLIDRYQKRHRLQTVENIGFLALGIGLTIGAFLAADSITDHMEINNGASVSF